MPWHPLFLHSSPCKRRAAERPVSAAMPRPARQIATKRSSHQTDTCAFLAANAGGSQKTSATVPAKLRCRHAGCVHLLWQRCTSFTCANSSIRSCAFLGAFPDKCNAKLVVSSYFLYSQGTCCANCKKGVTWGLDSAVSCLERTVLESRRRCKSSSTVFWCAACLCAQGAARSTCC